ncbi:3-oxoacyl-acyl-carrier-protein reductase [Asticcacaulis biprosthecium C19]|uniref:D-xylose 1-dehydrogenase n=1 Tax=Asticcacaulis biprosthecium C19 TaxID=715226 RepID=F4QPS3_9CAUL|nr:glucose 1-dehydrogenase [Asticcacaulis biprosthecium]EGF90210.1 3-oxoacyl-acyl-carrier-protein reductase [Asticcacaulis biprosthecium C19]
MLDDLQAKLVLITGASTGIGAAVAQAFAAHGARVALHYNSSRDAAQAVADLIGADGGEAHLIQADLMNAPESVRDVVAEAARKLGGLDILVNNAGALVARKLLMEWDDGFYDNVLDLNLRSVIIGTQAAVPLMEARGGGAVINLGSIAGSNGGGPGSGLYATAKAAVHNLTRHMATDLAKKNIRVNAIAPGVIGTPFHTLTPADRMEAMRNSVPMGRIGAPEDCVGPVLFLASAMSGYVTGQVLHVNGGQYYAGQ